MRSSSPDCGAIIDVRLNKSLNKNCTLFSSEKNSFSFDRSHKFEEIYTYNCRIVQCKYDISK